MDEKQQVVQENFVNTEYLQTIDSEVKSGKSVYKGMFETIIYMLISLVIIVGLRMFVVQHVKVSGTSMDPTLKDEQHLLIEKISYRFGEIKRFDIVVFEPYKEQKDTLYVKRIIGLPGETVYINDNSIYINGEKIIENYGGTTETEEKDRTDPVTLGYDEYYVLGDNRIISLDSRSSEVGNVNKDAIIGKVWVSIYPFDKISLIDHE